MEKTISTFRLKSGDMSERERVDECLNRAGC